jgi:isopenicillin-N epimerase
MAKDPAEIVEAFVKAANERTRLFFFSHVLSPTGLVLPAKELCAEARRRGILTVIDGAHAPAMIDLNVGAIGCDFYGSNCHKWLLAPSGSGFLYFAPGNEDRLQPLMVSWGYHFDHKHIDERDEFGSTPRLRALEFEGTRDPCAWLVIPAAIDFQADLGWERIRACHRELSRHVRETLGTLADLELITPDHPQLHGTLTAFRMPGHIDLPALRRGLWDHRIEVNAFDRPEGPVVRTSTHFYNTEQEVDRLAAVLPDLLAQSRNSP